METKLKIFEIFLVLLAILLSIAWFLHPKVSYEPALAIIGFALASIEIFRRVFLPQNEFTEDDITERVEQVAPVTTSAVQNSEKQQDTYPEKNSGISIEDILAGIDSKQYTGIQISQFVERNSGVDVVWRVKVHDIKPGFEHDPNSELLLTFSPESQQSNSLPYIALAAFDRSHEGDLAAVSSGDIAVIRGEISFSQMAGKYSPILKNAKLVRFYKNA